MGILDVTKCESCGWGNLHSGLIQRGGLCNMCKKFVYLPKGEKEKKMTPKKESKLLHSIPLTSAQVKEFIEYTATNMGRWTLEAVYDPDENGPCGMKGRMGVVFPFTVPTIEKLYDYMHEYIPSTAPKPIPMTAWVCILCDKAYQYEGEVENTPRCPECGEPMDLYEPA